MTLKKNDIVPLTITSATAEGSGVGKTADGMAVFVPFSAVGDELNVRILKVKKTYAFGKIEEILTPSPSRIQPDCAAFGKCGGCAWRHISYAAECAVKEQKVRDAVERIGGLENFKINPIIPSPDEERYRNKAQYPVGTGKNGEFTYGFFGSHSHRIVPCGDCKLQPAAFSRAMEIIGEFMSKTDNTVYDELSGKGRLRHVYMRRGEVTGELMVCLVVNSNGLKSEDLLVQMLKNGLPNLKSMIINSNRKKTNVVLGNKNRVIFGREYIEDELCGLKFKISPFSFWQVNRSQAENLYAKAREYAALNGNEMLLDLYCGTGTIGLSMAEDCERLLGVEIVPQAVEDARQNAENNNISNAKFICADAEKAALQLETEGLRPDCVILDPPRKGCGEQLVKTVAEMNPSRVVYVSCDPATLARDLKYFALNGYAAAEITPVDMFPRTHHVECAAVILKADGG